MQMLDRYQRTCVQIDLDAAVYNMNQMKQNLSPDTQIMAVVKTDGYGHGAIPIAHVLEPLPFLYGFAVATAEEGLILRKTGITKPILVLGHTFPYSYPDLVGQEICMTVFREDTLQELSRAAQEAGRGARVHIKVDTGMSRIGVPADDNGLSFVKKALSCRDLIVEGIFTHFARADEADKTAAQRQRELFCAFTDRIEKELGCRIPIRHCSNSAGIIEMPQANLDMVRAGITLYGLWPSEEVRQDIIGLRPLLSWQSSIVYCKECMPGTSVSYGGAYTLTEKRRIATIPVGYGDGYPRSLSGRGHVLIHGKKAPILGRICMDQFMVDITDIPQAENGDEVTLIGKNGGETITAEELGRLSGRFNYELVCDIGRRVPRVYLYQGRIAASRDCSEDTEGFHRY